MPTASEWKQRLKLQPHPEGGWFRETYRSNESVSQEGLPSRFTGPRSFSTAIYYLIEGNDFSALHRIRHWLHLDASELQDQEKQALEIALQHSSKLRTIYQLKQELAQVWARSTVSQEQLLKNLEDWCHRAEASGIKALEEFSHRLRCYKMT